MRREPQRYLSYLLRLWQTRSEGELIWRASLEEARTGESTGFASIEALFAHLRRQMRAVPDTHVGRREGEGSVCDDSDQSVT